MQCPDIHELPIPGAGKAGWPWTVVPPKPEWARPDGSDWPAVSIITPSYNQEPFLEETIRSVLLQGYPNLEYIVIDGGSGDGSAEIIEKYSHWLTYWGSEPDRGQSHAINKGFNKASGKVFGWLNSDDLYAPNALFHLMHMRQNSPLSLAWVGACRDVDMNGRHLRKKSPRIGTMRQFANWNREAWIPQPSCLFDAKTFRELGGLDEQLDFVMDVDLWMRLSGKGVFESRNDVISYARKYAGIKSLRDIPMQQAEHIFVNFKNGIPEMARQRMSESMTFGLDAWPYRRLLRYFMKRSVTWAAQRFRWMCRL